LSEGRGSLLYFSGGTIRGRRHPAALPAGTRGRRTAGEDLGAGDLAELGEGGAEGVVVHLLREVRAFLDDISPPPAPGASSFLQLAPRA